MTHTDPDHDLVLRARDGDDAAWSALLKRHHDRLKRMVQLRLHPKLRSRVDPSDVLQESFLAVSRRLEEYQTDQEVPFFVWLRRMTGLKLAEIHRRHLGTEKRAADRELRVNLGPLPPANSASLAARLLGNLTTPSEAAVRAEQKLRLHAALSNIDPLDREIVALRHFEQLSNRETAEVLGIAESTASDHHLRAIKHLRQVLRESGSER